MSGFAKTYVDKQWLIGGESNDWDEGIQGDAVLVSIGAGGTATSEMAELGYGAGGFALYFCSHANSTITIDMEVYANGGYTSGTNWCAVTPSICSFAVTGDQWYCVPFTPPAARRARFKVTSSGATTFRMLMMSGG
jgi:hypothetical protein